VGESLRWPRNALYPLKLALTSPTSGGRPVGTVRLRTQATEFSLELNSFITSAFWTQCIKRASPYEVIRVRHSVRLLVSSSEIIGTTFGLDRLIRTRRPISSEEKYIFFLVCGSFYQLNKHKLPMKDPLLTPWSRIILEKITTVHLVKQFPTFHEFWWLMIVLTRARLWFL
jgi:hypothetical protein